MWHLAIIARNTFRENIRDRVLYNLLLFAALLCGGSVLLAQLTIMERDRIMTDIGLAAINLFGVIIAIFVGIGLVSKEIEKRTIYTILARPIQRLEFILGKFVGLALTLTVNMAAMLCMYLFTLWINNISIHVSLIQAAQLMLVEVILVTAIALLFSTFTTASLSAIFTLSLYVVGHLTADLKAIAGKSNNDVVESAVMALYYLCPNLEMLNMKDQAGAGLAITGTYELTATCYGLFYTGLLLASAGLLFQRREF
jgi:Cu-processing system permease protein